MENVELFNKYAHGEHWKKHPTFYAESFSNFLKDQNFKGTLVDAGCGNGRDAEVFVQRLPEAKVIGVDKDQKEIEDDIICVPGATFMVENIEFLSFRDNQIGAYFMINVIHYLDQKKALAEIYRTLKPKGYLFVHFNLEILGVNGELDYQQDEKDIRRLISFFEVVKEDRFERFDTTPTKHTHKILQLILQKN